MHRIVGLLKKSWPATGGVDDHGSFASDSHSPMEFGTVAFASLLLHYSVGRSIDHAPFKHEAGCSSSSR